MAAPDSRNRETPPERGLHEPERPRKKLRKGTKSCWECKRRKVRCIFTGPGDSICNGCRRRKTACISQDLPDAPLLADGDRKPVAVEDRLGRVEALVEHLVEQLAKDGNPKGTSELLLRKELTWPSSFDALGMVSLSDLIPFPEPFMPTGVITQRYTLPAVTKDEALSRKLFAAWPTQHDLGLLLNESTGNPELLLSKACRLPSTRSTTIRELLQPPPPASHPTLIARKLLLLSIHIQATWPEHLSEIRGIVSRALEAASLVTGNDEIASSVEGIECIMMESMYHDTAGNVRRAWITVRRAITMAQMMGLHQRRKAMLTLPETPESLDSQQIWFRLVQTDRYISLLLGLPQGSADNVFATPSALEHCTPIEKLRRLDCLAAGQILHRNPSDIINNPATTREIDKLLQRASSLMPPQWWLIPAIPPSTPTPDEDTTRLLDQFTHFHILARLHLPYLLLPHPSPSPSPFPSPSPSHTSSKITAITASRELLLRFLALRALTPGPTTTTTSSLSSSYCRGMAFFAFIAAATLCIAHIEACRQEQQRSEKDGKVDDLAFLAHQRMGDRGMVERVLACFVEQEQHGGSGGAGGGAGGDAAVAGRMAAVLGRLMAIEEDATWGRGWYRASCSEGLSTGGDGGGGGVGGEAGGVDVDIGAVDEEGQGVRVCIPFWGTVEIERGSDLGSGVEEAGVGEGCDQGVVPELAAAGGVDEWVLHGVDTAFESLVRELEGPDAGEEEPWTAWVNDGEA